MIADDLRILRELGLAAACHELTWGPVTVELRSPVARHHTWFQAYLHTTHAAPAPAEHRHRVLATEDAALFARLAGRLAGRPHTLAEDYAGRPYLHGRVEDATYWLTGQPDDLLGEQNPYLVIHQGGDWHVLSPPTDLAASNPTLVARELLRWHLLAGGALAVHASSAWLRGSGLMFSGNAGSGKTTLALAAARQGGRFISGDRAALGPATSGITVTGTAMAARVRNGTLAGLGLDARLNGRPPLRKLPGKQLVTQTELESLCAIDTTAAAPLAAAVCTVRADRSTPRLEELSPDEMGRLLAPQILEYDNEWPRRWLLAGLGRPGPPPVAERRENVLRDLAKRRLFRLIWDPHLGTVAAALARITTGLGAG